MHIIRDDGAVVEPSADSVKACVDDTYDSQYGLFHLRESEGVECYPFSEAYNIITHKNLDATHDDDCGGFVVETIQFILWLASSSNINKLLEKVG